MSTIEFLTPVKLIDDLEAIDSAILEIERLAAAFVMPIHVRVTEDRTELVIDQLPPRRGAVRIRFKGKPMVDASRSVKRRLARALNDLRAELEERGTPQAQDAETYAPYRSAPTDDVASERDE